MQVKFEAGDLEQSKFLGEGEHVCVVAKMEQKLSKTKGEPMMEIEFRDASGKTTRDWFMLTGNRFKLAALALAAGFTKEALLSGSFETGSLMGKPVKIVRRIKSKDDLGRNNYENEYLPAGALVSSKSDDEIPF